MSTSHLTLLRPGFTSEAVGEAHGFDRVYTQVLPSARIQAAMRQELRNLPVDASYVTANIRLLLPPEVLRQVLDRLQGAYVRVVTGTQSDLDLATVIQPVVDHAATVLAELVPGAAASAPRVSQQSVAGFAQAFAAWIEHLRAGRAPLRLPDVALTPGTAHSVAGAMTAGLPSSTRATVTVRVERYLQLGDLTGALAAVLPLYIAPRLADVITTSLAAASSRLAGRAPSELAQELRVPRVLPVSLGWIAVLGAGLLLLGAAGLARNRARGAREPWLCVALALGLAALSGLLLASALPDPLRAASRSASLSVEEKALLLDIDGQVRHQLVRTYVEGLVSAGAVAAAVIAAVRAARRRRGPSRASYVGGGLLTASLVVIATTAVVRSSAVPETCNGSAALCSRGYDEATYLTSHNAMASSARFFLNAAQDADLAGQLDAGVRGLMLDLHYWTVPSELEAFVAGLDPRTRAGWQPLLRAAQPRTGVWLCHVVCQVGADPAVQRLRAVASWLRAHRDAVVTLILEDHVSEQDLRATIEQAGLLPYVATPPTGGAPWPRLGDMVRRNHRLVVFSERARPKEGWLRNFYQYAAETPFSARSATSLSCAQGRGPATAPLFLLNNWVSTPAPSRAAAYVVNAEQALSRRVQQCSARRGMRPTFVAVDFAQTGSALEVVDELNR